MSFADRLGAASDRFYDRMRSPEAKQIADAAPTGKLEDLWGRKYCVLVTFKKSGEAVPAPLWFGSGDGKVFVQTGASTAKVKRIARNPAVRVAPATSRGRPLGPPFLGTACVVPPEGEANAERWLQANYGMGRRVYMRFLDRVQNVYVEITPAATD